MTIQNTDKIVLDETQNINKVSALYVRMKELLDQGKDIVIDVSQVNVIDTSTLQLLVCLSREADSRHHPAQIQEVSDNFANAAKILGIEAMLGLL